MPEEAASHNLHELAGQVLSESHKLMGATGGHSITDALRPLLRAMNSYYTNKIEGQHTRPIEIEKALKQNYLSDKTIAKKQRLAIAHMDAEKALEEEHSHPMFSPEFIKQIHAYLYSRLLPEDRFTDEGLPILPGECRTDDVAAGYHKAPPFREVQGLLKIWADDYSAVPRGEKQIIAVACSHHRLTWVHPFIDGNGRTARLHSHLAFHRIGLTNGLWSPMRGLARAQAIYFRDLNNADLPRRHDADGRGPLSQSDLVVFAEFFLTTCLDQIRFMSGMLDLKNLKPNIRQLLAWLEGNPKPEVYKEYTIKPNALEPLHYIAIGGEIDKVRFLSMTGLGERMGQRLLGTLLALGILTETSRKHKAPLKFGIPFATLRFLFPKLWPEAESDAFE